MQAQDRRICANSGSPPASPALEGCLSRLVQHAQPSLRASHEALVIVHPQSLDLPGFGFDSVLQSVKAAGRAYKPAYVAHQSDKHF